MISRSFQTVRRMREAWKRETYVRSQYFSSESTVKYLHPLGGTTSVKCPTPGPTKTIKSPLHALSRFLSIYRLINRYRFLSIDHSGSQTVYPVHHSWVFSFYIDICYTTVTSTVTSTAGFILHLWILCFSENFWFLSCCFWPHVLAFRLLACSRRLDSGEQVKSYAASPKRNTREDWCGSEKTLPFPFSLLKVN